MPRKPEMDWGKVTKSLRSAQKRITNIKDEPEQRDNKRAWSIIDLSLDIVCDALEAGLAPDPEPKAVPGTPPRTLRLDDEKEEATS